MATTSPLARVKEEFGGKDKLVDKIVGLLDSDFGKRQFIKIQISTNFQPAPSSFVTDSSESMSPGSVMSP